MENISWTQHVMNKILQHVSEKEKIDEHNQRKTSKVDWVCSLL